MKRRLCHFLATFAAILAVTFAITNLPTKCNRAKAFQNTSAVFTHHQREISFRDGLTQEVRDER
jgi:hypothetical protein